MKAFFSFLTVLLMVFAITPDADARKFGGGKSMGKSYKTAPASNSTANNRQSLNQQNSGNQQAAPNTATSKKGFMGGMLGGLLAGGLLAALFAGGAFEGFQFADFIIMAVLGFIIFKIIQMMRAKKMQTSQSRAAYATPGAHYQEPSRYDAKQSSMNTSASVNDEVPFNTPPNFDQTAFLNGAREHYRILQQAWNKNQLATIQEYVSIELYNELAKERAALDGEQHTEVLYVDAKIVRADHNNENAQLSLQFSGRYKDEKEGIEENINDIWHLERSLKQNNAPWLIVGIEG